MSIIEVLRGHHEWDVDVDYSGGQDAVTCPCGWRELLGLNAGEQHRAHVAKMLEQRDMEPIIDAIREEIEDAPCANYEEDNYDAGYLAGLQFALDKTIEITGGSNG